MTTWRPGPPAVLPGLAPGGIVIQVYDDSNVLLIEQRLHAGVDADVEAFAAVAVDVVDRLARRGARVCIVAFDGDTGERSTFGLPAGKVAGFDGG